MLKKPIGFAEEKRRADTPEADDYGLVQYIRLFSLQN